MNKNTYSKPAPIKRSKKASASVTREPLRLDFSGQQLEQFDELYQGLLADSNRKEIGAIDLSNNNLQRMFSREFKASYSTKGQQMPVLPSVTHLNLLGNQDLTIKEVIGDVTEIMPEISVLQICLSYESDVSFIMDAMPKLTMLNGIKVERELLSQHPTERGGEESNEPMSSDLVPKDVLSDIENTLVQDRSIAQGSEEQNQKKVKNRRKSKSLRRKERKSKENEELDKDYILMQANHYAKAALDQCQMTADADPLKTPKPHEDTPMAKKQSFETFISLKELQGDGSGRGQTQAQASVFDYAAGLKSTDDVNRSKGTQAPKSLIERQSSIYGEENQNQNARVIEQISSSQSREAPPLTTDEDLTQDAENENMKRIRQEVIENNSYLEDFHSERQSDTDCNYEEDQKLQELQEMKQLENILAVEQRQLSEILEEDREEFENGCEFASGHSDLKRLGENAKTAGSKSNQLSSMQSNESKMKGIGSGLTTINQTRITHDIAQIQNQSQEQAIEDINQNVTQSLEISSSQIIDGSKEKEKQDQQDSHEAAEASVVNTARISLSNCSDYDDAELGIDESKPHLKPKDLEDIANIFDRIRILAKKKDDQFQPPPKKLIAKCPPKIDDLAKQFDVRLSEVMLTLSQKLRDELLTNTQKWVQIENSKLELFIYCSDTASSIIQKNKSHIMVKDAKDLGIIFQKVKQGMTNCFENLKQLFYSKSDSEVYEQCKAQVAIYKAQAEKSEAETLIKHEQMTAEQAEVVKQKEQVRQLEQMIKGQQETIASLNDRAARQAKTIQDMDKDLADCQKGILEQDKQISQMKYRAEMAERELEKNRTQDQIKGLELAKKQVEHDLTMKRQQAEIKEQHQQIQIMRKQIDDSTYKQGELTVLNKELKQTMAKELSEQAKKYEEQLQMKDHEIERKEVKIKLQFWIMDQIMNAKGTAAFGSKQLRQKYNEVKRRLLYEESSPIDLKSQNCPSNYAKSPLLLNQKNGSIVKRRNNASGRQQRGSVECQSRKSQHDVKSPLHLGNSRSPAGQHANFQKARLNQSAVDYRKGDLSQRSGKSCELQAVATFEQQSPKKNPRRSHSSLVKSVKQSQFGDMISKAAHAPPTIQQSEILLSHHSKSAKSISKHSKSLVETSPRILNISAHMASAQGRNEQREAPIPMENVKCHPTLCKSNNTVSQRSMMDPSIAEPASAIDHSRASVSGFIGRSAVEPITPSAVGTNMDTKRREVTQTSHDGHKISMQDCDPSPTKEGEDRITNHNDLGLANDNSSVCIEQSRNLDISKLHTIQNFADEAFLDHVSQHMTRVPTLQFNGIGFSFNETQNNNQHTEKAGQRGFEDFMKGPTIDPMNSAQVAGHKEQFRKSQIMTKVLAQCTGTADDSSNRVMSKRSKSTPNGSITNLHFVGGSMGNLPERIQGTSKIPVPSTQISSQVQNIIKQELQIGLTPINTNVYSNFNSFVQSPVGSNEIQKEQPKLASRKQSGSSKQRTSSNAPKSGLMPLKQLKEFISDIYLQKVKNDDKCVNQNKQTRETMEQYLYTYLNHKYGLKQLVIEQAKNLIAAIAHYQETDHDVHLFGLVLRHDIEEEFRGRQQAMLKSIVDMVKQNIASKYPTKRANDLEKMVNDIQGGKALVEYSIWSKVVRSMFTGSHAEMIISYLKLKGNNQQASEASASNMSKTSTVSFKTDLRAEDRRKNQTMHQRGRSRESRSKYLSKSSSAIINLTPKVAFHDLCDVILNDQLSEHIRFLRKFMDLFKQIDKNNDGIITNNEFVELYTKMNIVDIEFFNRGEDQEAKRKFDKEIDYFLDILDPFQCDKIILSDIIKLFMGHKVEILDFQTSETKNYFASQQAAQSCIDLASGVQLVDNKYKIASDSETFFDAKPQATLSDTYKVAPQLYQPTDGTERAAIVSHDILSSEPHNTIDHINKEEEQLNNEILELEKMLKQNN